MQVFLSGEHIWFKGLERGKGFKLKQKSLSQVIFFVVLFAQDAGQEKMELCMSFLF